MKDGRSPGLPRLPGALLQTVRDAVNTALEEKRKAKVIGTSLGAQVRIAASGPVGALLQRHVKDLPGLFIVSEVALEVGDTGAADALQVEVDKAAGVKCERCWRFVPAVATDEAHAGLCPRCECALAGTAHA